MIQPHKLFNYDDIKISVILTGRELSILLNYIAGDGSRPAYNEIKILKQMRKECYIKILKETYGYFSKDDLEKCINLCNMFESEYGKDYDMSRFKEKFENSLNKLNKKIKEF